jgi:hypothetical protein
MCYDKIILLTRNRCCNKVNMTDTCRNGQWFRKMELARGLEMSARGAGEMSHLGFRGPKPRCEIHQVC